MDCIVHRVAKSQMRLSDFHFPAGHLSLAPLMGRGYHKSSRQCRSAACSLQLWPQKAEDRRAGAEGRDSGLIACTVWATQREEPSHQVTKPWNPRGPGAYTSLLMGRVRVQKTPW